jgi:uncharacterized OB-fold protein
MSETLNRQIKIYCPQHQTTFEVEADRQIVCEIREHALSNNFPKSEFWAYCCDCQTFSPSNLDTGGKAENNCPHCERPTARRFLCDECKIISYDSDEETKGKIFGINNLSGINPTCAGCLKTFIGAKIHPHICPDIEGILLTSRRDCPFCRKSILDQSVPPSIVEEFSTDRTTTKLDRRQVSTQCANCGHWGNADRAFCGKCGGQVNSLDPGILPGTAEPKTQLLGSICPKCGSVHDSDGTFCGKCGQALKVVPPKDETVADPIFSADDSPLYVIQPKNSFIEKPVVPALVKTGQTSSGLNKVLLFTGLGIVSCIVVGVITLNLSKPIPSSNNSVNNSNNKNTASNSGRSNSPKPDNSSSSLIGHKGRLTTNLNIRSASNKYAEIIGTHYENAKVQILEVESFYADDREFVTWYKIRVLENGFDQKNGNGKGNNWERNENFGWMEAEPEGWMNAKYISLE